MEMEEILKENNKYRFGPGEMIGFANWAQQNGWLVHSPHLMDWIDGWMKHDKSYDGWTKGE